MRGSAWIDRSSRNRDISDELESHLRMAAQDRIDQGDPPEAARLAAEQELGDVRLVEASIRSVWIETFPARCLRYCRKQVRRTPVFVGMSLGLAVPAVIGSGALNSGLDLLLLWIAGKMSAGQDTVFVIAVALVTLLALVVICANLANLSLDRRRDAVLRRSRGHMRPGHNWLYLAGPAER